MSGKLEIEKAYEASKVEDDIYAAWEKSGYFTPENLPDFKKRKEAFSIMLPPPNVTGTLHMGHAVMLAIEDIMTRFARMRGKRALWLPGTDHAAIATQAKVEKLLIESGLKDPRHDLGREAFLKHVEEYAQQSHDIIVNQIKKMGASVDWSREAFTLDEQRNLAVRTIFKRMYDDGLIYRGNRVINWCPRCLSTLSDDELEYKETTTKLYTFKYDKNFPVSISTTRPETKLGDTAVAVHPKDKRYKKFVGKTFDVNFAGGPLKIKIVADDAVDLDFGTGAVGVTPAHSKIDEEIAKRHDLPSLQVIDEQGRMTKEAGDEFLGLLSSKAREKVVVWLKDQGLLEAEEEARQNLSVCYRCDTPVEPMPKVQWFIDVEKPFKFRQSKRAPIKGLKDGQKITLKEAMQHVVRSGQVKIIPKRFDKIYFQWIDNLRDWNISRQIWYGHRVPVWYKSDEVYVGVEEPDGKGWQQDKDTLDTWFSSGLWTFSTLGWPQGSEDLETYHPTDVLETGYDILFFWVARMILMTTYALGEIPFEHVYLHGLIRDEKGRKMSKSLGNVIDPLDMIKKYGADATRLSLVIGSTPGNDMKFSKEKVAGFKNFTNKLWNIARFVFVSVGNVESVGNVKGETLADRWVLGRFSEVVEKVTRHLEKFEYSLAGEALRDFTWGEFADWYIEIAKVKSQKSKVATDKILLYILERLLILWHPFMPFVSEEIYKRFDRGMLIVAPWPDVGTAFMPSDEDKRTFEDLRGVIISIRNIRARYKIDPKKKLDATIVSGGYLEDQSEIIQALAKVENLTFDDKAKKPEGSASAVVGQIQIYVPLVGIVDLEQEKAKLEKELASTEQYAASLEKKLADKAFLKKAPKEVVRQEKEKLQNAKVHITLLETEINSLS